jgi:hypothetical protein
MTHVSLPYINTGRITLLYNRILVNRWIIVDFSVGNNAVTQFNIPPRVFTLSNIHFLMCLSLSAYTTYLLFLPSHNGTSEAQSV